MTARTPRIRLDSVSRKYDSSPLDPYIKAAVGFFKLRDTASGMEELEKVPQKLRTVGALKMMRLEIELGLESWDGLAEYALSLPDIPGAHLYLAIAEKNRSGLAAAEGVLRQALLKYPYHPLIQYYLASYVCQQGRLEEARVMMRRSMGLDPKLEKFYRKDPVWRPFHQSSTMVKN